MENNYECKICDCIYKSRNGLFKHKIKYHPIKEDITPKKYKCDYCEKSYDSRQSKWMHGQKCKLINTKKENLDNQVSGLANKLKIIEDIINTHSNKNTMETQIIKNSNNNQLYETLTNKLCEKDLVIAKLKDYQYDGIINSNFCFNEFIMPEKINIANNIFTGRSLDNYYDAIQICNVVNKNFADWLALTTTNDVLIELQKETDLQLIIIESEVVWIHPFLVLFLTQWISPIFLLQLYSQLNFQVNKLTIENTNLCNTIKKKDNELSTLKNIFVRKHSRINYPEKNVLYLITTEQNKANRIYIVGKASNLKERLGTYNKTCEHEVIYYRSCHIKENMGLCEQMVLNKLNKYREVANRDRFVLPIDKGISFFTNIFDSVIDFYLDNKSTEIEI